EAGDRGAAIETMALGATAIVLDLFAQGRLHGLLGLGGSGGSALATQAMRALPVGVPKLMVSTLASGDTRPYVGEVDVTMMYSVVDISGVNNVSARIMANAAGAIAGMVGAEVPQLAEKPLVAASMFGVTTPCVTRARERLGARVRSPRVPRDGRGRAVARGARPRRFPRRGARRHHNGA